jgi:MFS transporter, putative metabolite:H+ symporter
MLDQLDAQPRLSRNQRKLITAATIGVMLEFLDYFLIGFVLTFVAKPWGLSVWLSSVILLSSGIGAIVGAFAFGRLADRIGRRRVFLATIATFTVGTLALAFTPDSPTAGPAYLIVFRLVVGAGVGGLYCVDLPLVQEFVPTRMRGWISGMVTAAVPVGLIVGSALVTWLAPVVGWRSVFVACVALSLVTLFIRAWIPESPRWLLRRGRAEDARASLGWALGVAPDSLPLPTAEPAVPDAPYKALFKHRRSLLASWVTNLGGQTGYYGLALWAPALVVAILGVSAVQAAYYMLFVSLAALVGRLLVAFLSERFGRRWTGVFVSFGAAAAILLTGYAGDATIGVVPLLILLLMLAYLLCDGAFAVVGPYSAEVWPASLRSTGMGSAYGFGGLGKVIGPLGMAFIVSSPNLFNPTPNPAALVPAFWYFAFWYALAGAAFVVFGIETRNRTIEIIDAELSGRVAEPAPDRS